MAGASPANEHYTSMVYISHGLHRRINIISEKERAIYKYKASSGPGYVRVSEAEMFMVTGSYRLGWWRRLATSGCYTDPRYMRRQVRLERI
jgi:hypothetical protein